MICKECKADPPNHQLCPNNVHKSWCDCQHAAGTALNPKYVKGDK